MDDITTASLFNNLIEFNSPSIVVMPRDTDAVIDVYFLRERVSSSDTGN